MKLAKFKSRDSSSRKRSEFKIVDSFANIWSKNGRKASSLKQTLTLGHQKFGTKQERDLSP